MSSYVYVLNNVISGSSYVGKSTDPKRRWRRHKTDANAGCELPLHRAIRKYGIDAFELQILEECSSDAEALLAEAQQIASYRQRGITLYNLTDGGEGASGMKMSEESRAAIRHKLMGHSVTDETRSKLSLAQKGIPKGPRPDWVKERISAGKRGRAVTEDHRKKLSESQKGKSRPKSSEVLQRMRVAAEAHESVARDLFMKGFSLKEIHERTKYAVSSLKKLVTKWNKELKNENHDS